MREAVGGHAAAHRDSTSPPQQIELRLEDVWIGVTDPKERRMLQNRLNQRARSRLANESLPSGLADDPDRAPAALD